MYLQSFAISNKGPDHVHNEDSYFISDENQLYIVADGVGSYKGAEVASALVVSSVAEFWQNSTTMPIRNRLTSAIKSAVAAVFKKGKDNPEWAQMATSLTLLYVIDDMFYTAHVGDSRCYILADKKLRQITVDHSVAFEQYLYGAISKEQIASHPNQKLITRTISARQEFVVPDIASENWHDECIWFLCSDGVTKELTDAEIASILLENPIEAVGNKIVELVKSREGNDDTTVILVKAQ